MEQLKQLLTAAGIAYKENEPLAAHCTFKIGGPARLFVQPADRAQLCRAVALCKAQGVRYYLLGNGSNILFADEGYNGVALMLAAAVLAALLTKALVQPVLNMTEDLDHIQENVPYRELIPFAESIHSDRILRENNEKMRQEFTANVSHELKTPLTSISGYAELIETGIAKPEDVPDFGRKIHSEATRMIQLVNDILQLSKLDTVSETGDTPVMETVDLLEVAKECVERQKLNARRAYISLTYLGESAPVLGSRALLDELCQNLCDNAIRYNRPGGKVQIITTCNRDGHCSLTVADNGIGIPREAQASVFERFYRVDKSRSKATGGTGLGLAIVKHIALIHGARIKLESQVDVGTTITVTFPTAS